VSPLNYHNLPLTNRLHSSYYPVQSRDYAIVLFTNPTPSVWFRASDFRPSGGRGLDSRPEHNQVT